LFQEALRQPVADRDHWLREACAGDADLHREVASLLANHHDATSAEGWPAAAAQLIMKPVLLEPGQYLGPYQITSFLAAGGMGEVYRARDTKLKRDVAIKILPDEFSRDADRLSRFLREAEVLASLNHPNIGAIYDLQEVNGVRFLVLELVEGETLADRVQRGPIPVTEALAIGKHICEALEAAHDKGVVHRDLKPANVKITPDDQVKVLDFGLAKVMENKPASGTLSNSPTLTIGATQGGVILGTAAYMSPEQAKGFELDARSDTFAFGSVLYEMLTGRQAFQGDTVPEVLAAVLVREPDFSLLPPNLNPRLEELLERCLQKNPKRRWQAVGDLRAELETIAATPRIAPAPAKSPAARRAPWKSPLAMLFVAIIFTFIGVVGERKLRPSTPALVARFQFLLSQAQQVQTAPRPMIAVSPDGTELAYIANGANGQIFLRQMSELEFRPVPGAVSASGLFFSPDGRWIGFYSLPEKALKKIAVAGGFAVTICKLGLDNPPSGASWDRGQIIFGVVNKGIMRVSENGGEPETLLSIKGEEGYAISPQLLDDGRAVLFTLTPPFGGPQTWDRSQIVAQPLPSGKRKVIVPQGADAHYLPSGHIVYALEGNILAAPFDQKQLELRGGAVPVLTGVLQYGFAQLSYSGTGTLAYIPGSLYIMTGQGSLRSPTVLALVDRTGRTQPLPLPPGSYEVPRISPDGKRIALESSDGKEERVLVYELSGGGSLRPLTFGGNATLPVWSNDGRHIFFSSDREGSVRMYRQLADGTGPAEPLTKPEQGISRVYASSVDPFGKVLALMLTRGTRSTGQDLDIWMLPLNGDRQPVPYVQEPRTQSNADFSPNGRWLAYASNEVDFLQYQILVRPYPKTDSNPYQITMEGGGQPVWSRDGKQIFYYWDSKFFAVDVRTEPTFSWGKPSPLPISGAVQTPNAPRNYDVGPDGKFLIVLPASQGENTQAAGLQVNVVLNWLEELKQRVPVR